jgi:alkaline phosphatase
MNHAKQPKDAPFSRRAFLHGGALMLGGLLMGRPAWVEAGTKRPILRIGMVADVHHADHPVRGRTGGPDNINLYRQSMGKFREAVERFKIEKPDFVVELGDFIDKAPTLEQEMEHLRNIEKVYAGVRCERHYVLGNHCVDALNKEEFFDITEARAPHYSFDAGGFHFVILDSCFTEELEPYGRSNWDWTNANLPPDQLDWLVRDLGKTGLPTIVLAHQRLDGDTRYDVRNAAAARKIMAESGKVSAVFQGHSHRNDYRQVDGIHYITLVAVVAGHGSENSGYSMVSLHGDASIRIDGFRLQQNLFLEK